VKISHFKAKCSYFENIVILNVMKFNRYTNVLRDNIDELNQAVNDIIAKGGSVMGGLGMIHLSQKLFYYQTIVVEDENNDVLGDYLVVSQNLDYLEEVKRLAQQGNKLEAVKLYKDMTGLGLKDAKDWVDINC
jgi:hypothetical protein